MVSRYAFSGIICKETNGSPKFPGYPFELMPCSLCFGSVSNGQKKNKRERVKVEKMVPIAAKKAGVVVELKSIFVDVEQR